MRFWKLTQLLRHNTRAVETYRLPPYIGMMKKFLVPLLALAPLTFGSAHAADPLESLKWKNRPVLLFAKSRSDAGLDKQVDLFRGFRPELRDRDIVVFSTTAREETRSVIGYAPINRGTARALTKRFQPSKTGLTVILVGKDGGQKGRWERVVNPQEIFDMIDKMPMRQDEISERSESG